ncbi:uncharacterized protein LOC135682724 [Rhopilema esculentum]|uniref:uncharacterized protein LOC135682724 n=1 Tax=Rhopilema esculentum TaxID=499914 RepID=UPI0031D918DA
MVNIILQDADQVESSSKYKIAIRINGIPVSGLSASRVPMITPPRRRYYPLFLSGSFKATKGDVISLATYSAVDSSYAILVSSSWSMFLVAEDGNSDQVGFAGPKKSTQNMFSTEASSWFDVNNWQPSSSNLGSFYTPSKINFDDSNMAIIKTTGFYLISANVEIQHSSEAPPVMKIALFIQNELQQNGITYENIRGWNSFSMHFNGVAFLIEGDTVSLKITSTSNFDGLVINQESGFSITRLPVAELFPAASLTALAKFKIPLATSLPIKVWTAENSEASFSFTSGKRYNKTSGIFRVNTAGYYLISMNLVLQSQSHNKTNISLTMMHGSGSDTFELTMTNGSVSSLSSTILKFQEVGSTIFIATNISLPFGNFASFNNSTSFPSSDIVLQEGSSFSAIHFPLKTTAATTSEAVYANSYSYSKATITELSDWTVSSEVDKSPAIYRADKDGIYFLSMNLKLIEFIGCVTFYFKSNRGNMATSTVTCKKHCREYITLNNFVRLRNGDRLSVFMHLEPNSYLTIAKDSRRTITYMRPYEEETGLSVRIINTSLAPATMGHWVPLYEYSLGNDTHGVFDARGNYSSFEGMIIPSTGAYQVIVNLVMLFANSSSGMGTVEIVVSKDGAISTTGGLYMKKKFQVGQNFTMHVMSSVVLPKWTKLKLFIRSDADVYIQEGSTVALAYLDSIIREICRDEGPVMGDPLRPAYIASAIVGEKREWRCQAFGNKPAKHLWYKNNQIISKKEYLQIDGNLNDTGRYHCVASIDGIMAESNQVQVQIYDVDECHYKNHTCDLNATCANTLGSFTCTCNAGFVGNGFKCNDTNECSLGTHNCANHSMCINTQGAFNCRCLDGFFGDGVKFCNDIDECLLSLDKCDRHATCNNLVGTYNCTCNKGWFGSGFTCLDANECALLTHNCDKNAYCNNTNGTAKCTCKEGFVGNGVAGNCSDINECLLLPTATPATLKNASSPNKLYCDAFADCVNLQGSYTCRCKAGFIGNGTSCQDINECELGSQSIKCAQVADCINLPGSYQCKCRAGYTGDGIQCADLDECAIKTFVCDPLANCSNTYGSYQCSCPKGYIGDGKTCADNAEIGKSTDPCVKDSTSLTCICKNSKTRDQNILCNGLFVAIIILSVVAIIVILFVIKYIKSRRNIKIGPVKTARGKYIEMEDESEV